MYKLIIYITIAIILVYVIVRSFKKKSFKRKIVKKTRTEKILKIINVFAWIFFVGTLVKFGIILTSFIISLFNPEFVVFKDIDVFGEGTSPGTYFYEIRESHLWNYIFYVISILLWTLIKSYLAYLIIKLLAKINLIHPFSIEIANRIVKISYTIIFIWGFSFVVNFFDKWAALAIGLEPQFEVRGELLFIAGLVYLIGNIFKRGVEIQNENKLTI
ncbi:MAG: DUF2975 domain-containing protein [Flavobacteriaceae bacterium]|nr:DUF2975 domain-containing protein [Flavobacteriaceae bacterium]